MDQFEKINERIECLIKLYANGKNTVFGNIIGVSEANIRNYLKGVMPKYDVLYKIATSFDISSDWLLTGRGEMINVELEENTGKQDTNMDETQLLREMIANLKETIELLKNSNNSLLNDKAKFEKQIEILNNKIDKLDAKNEELQRKNESLRETAKQQRTAGVA